MLKIIGQSIIDLLPFQQGILFVLKESVAGRQVKISFYSFNPHTKSIASVTKNAYLLTKFGSGFEKIVPRLDDYISCTVQKLNDGSIFILYPGGEIGIFSDTGELLHTDNVSYNQTSIQDAAFDGENIWSVAPDCNAIIRYNCMKKRIDLRLGDMDGGAFNCPVSIFTDTKTVYICCKNTKTVNTVSLNDQSTAVFRTFDEPIKQYLRVEDCEFAVLPSGVYLL